MFRGPSTHTVAVRVASSVSVIFTFSNMGSLATMKIFDFEVKDLPTPIFHLNWGARGSCTPTNFAWTSFEGKVLR